ncbi:MAG: SIS domain-containing protein [Candidatus Methylacidiphilales bacterium]
MPSISEQLQELSTLTDLMVAEVDHVKKVAEVVVHSLKEGGKILTCGNGGSASDAMHLVEELVGRYRSNRRALPGIALVADPTVLTCIANDWDYDSVFSRQVEAHGRPGDVLVVFSTSGNSASVIRALESARERGLVTIGLLGKDGGACMPLSDYAVVVPHSNTARIQEMHTWLLHVILEEVEMAFPV